MTHSDHFDHHSNLVGAGGLSSGSVPIAWSVDTKHTVWWTCR